MRTSLLKSALLKLRPVRNWYARLLKKHATKQVVATLSLAHAQELANTPGENWPLVKERQAREIAAVRDGKLDIVDRRSWAWPYLPSSISRIKQPLIKLTPFNLRRFSKTPVPRRAINLIKNAVISLEWDIRPIDNEEPLGDQEERIKASKQCFHHPNNTDSYQSFVEAGIEDMCTTGAMTIEPQLTPDISRPVKMWNVDTTTIRVFPTWTESLPDEPRYAQMTGLKGERGAILFRDRELLYIKDNPAVDTPFGVGKMEVAFQSVTSFLGVQDMAGRAGADQVHRTWLWWEQAQAPQDVDIIRRHLINDQEGQSKINMTHGFKKPDVIEVLTTTPEDLLLEWQEMLIRMIANAFDLSPLALGIERDVNRSTGEVLDDKDFRSAVVPIAIRLAEAFTRFILHRTLGYTDLEFKFLNLDDPDITTHMQQLTALYNMNAITANGVLEALGKPKILSPFADLTQFECIILNAEIAGKIQQNNQQKMMQNQMVMQDHQQQQQMEMQDHQMQQQMAQDYYSNPQQMQSSSALNIAAPKQAKMVPPKLPHPMKLKLPTLMKTALPGSRFNAQQIAAMSLVQLQAAMESGFVNNDAGKLQDSMEEQEPGILTKLMPEIQEYLESLKEEQEAEKKAKNKKKVSSKLVEDQKKRYRKMKHKPISPENGIFQQQVKRDSATGRGTEISTTDLDRMKRRPYRQ